MRDAKSGDSGMEMESPVRVSLFADIEINGCGLVFEELAWSEGYKVVAGVDEVGRGCLAGPVVAAACVLDATKPLPDGLNDSKQVPREQREEIAAELQAGCTAIGFGLVEADEIDRINILEATKVAMRKAIAALDPNADYLLVDALQLKGLSIPQRSIIKGDSISASIAAASILAKTFRDQLMHSYDTHYPGYGFAEHVGYATKAHLSALRSIGPCPLHRKSFKGVA
ncbi:MAG TPA: ribonuclease HII [Pyrinomonadaceae bacterium]